VYLQSMNLSPSKLVERDGNKHILAKNSKQVPQTESNYHNIDD
jgi:hypothetical protein